MKKQKHERAGRRDRRARSNASAASADRSDSRAGIATWPDHIDLPELTPDLYINRELSWLAFNERVLDEAADEANPLLERVKFAAIVAANLDEYFMIRVAGVKRKLSSGIVGPGPDGRTPAAQLGAIRTQVQEHLARHCRIFTSNLVPRLAVAGVNLVPYTELSDTERFDLGQMFERDIFPVLTPQAIDRGRPFPHVSNLSLNLIAVLRLPIGERFARVKVPATLGRLVPVPPFHPGLFRDEQSMPTKFTWLEQVVAAHLPRLFPGAEVLASFPFHVTRDSDIDLDDDDDSDSDLMNTMRASISLRAFGPVVRLMIDTTMPEHVRDWLVEHLGASERDLYVVDGPLGLEDLVELTHLPRPDLKDPTFVPAPIVSEPPMASGDAIEPRSIFEVLRERDVLVHHPYQSFDAVSEFVRAASTDPDVVAIKQTLYRIGRDSPLIPALIEARDDDTQVAVLVELKARFDEENNISWAQQLEQHGVHVAYGLAGLKTHCKATLVVRREPEGLRRYVHLATGNYNASTARIYEDLGLLTSQSAIGADVSDLFNVLTGFAQQDDYRKLWTAPVNLRSKFLAAIAREIEAHKRTGSGHLIFKMNALVDRTIIRALYAASRVGVRIDLIVRGVCCLRPGVSDWSETVRVVSVVGRFLEHSRVYYFHNDGDDELLLGSADLMERNFDHRVEAVFPVEDQALKAQLRDVILPAYLRDTVNARRLHEDGHYRRVEADEGERPFDVQAWLLRHYGASGEPDRRVFAAEAMPLG